MHFSGTPTPPAPSALLPRPLPGGVGSACDIRGTAVSGSSPGSPHAVDRGDIATGGGADGEGELVPPPLSLTLPRSHISSPPHPSRASGRGIPGYLAGLPHPTRACGKGYPYASAGPPLHHASGMCPVRPHGAVWWSIDRAEVSRACFGRQSLAEPPSRALQPAGGRDGGYIYIGTAR